MDGLETKETFLASLGIEGNNNGDDTATDANDTTDANNTDDGSDAGQAGQGTDPTPQPAEDKHAHAFAQMRIQNKQYEKMMKDVAGILGVQANDPTALMQALDEKVVKAQAEQQKVPEELLLRLRQLEERESVASRQQLEQQAYLGFQKVKDTYNLTDKELGDFANTLGVSGKNPFDTPLDLVTEYKLQNFDTLVAKAKEEGAKEEMERATKAATHSTQPNSKQSTGTGSQEKITTAKDLEAFFNSKK